MAWENFSDGGKSRLPSLKLILLMEEILHQLDMVNISLFTGFPTCRVVQDFFHQQYYHL